MKSRKPNLVPLEVRVELERHIRNSCKKAERSWEFSNQDEDTLTGDFFGNLRTDDWVDVGDYSFRFYHNKIRGRGPKALEGIVGTDGIITLEYISSNDEKIYKSFVFQAKKGKGRIEEDQIQKMDRFFPGSNLVFRYSKDSFVVEDFKGANIRICDFLIDEFFSCKYGEYDLFYDSELNRYMRKNIPIKIQAPIHDVKVLIQEKKGN